MPFVLATAICCSIKTHLSYYKVSMDDILKNSLELCEIFQFEFIFAKPCESLEFVINESVDKFNYMDILSAVEVTIFCRLHVYFNILLKN